VVAFDVSIVTAALCVTSVERRSGRSSMMIVPTPARAMFWTKVGIGDTNVADDGVDAELRTLSAAEPKSVCASVNATSPQAGCAVAEDEVRASANQAQRQPRSNAVLMSLPSQPNSITVGSNVGTVHAYGASHKPGAVACKSSSATTQFVRRRLAICTGRFVC